MKFSSDGGLVYFSQGNSISTCDLRMNKLIYGENDIKELAFTYKQNEDENLKNFITENENSIIKMGELNDVLFNNVNY